MPKKAKASGDRSSRVWLFSLAELPGFCARHEAIVSKLDARFLDMPCMLIVWRGKSKPIDQWTDALFSRLPESWKCPAPDQRRMFGLVDKVEKLVDKTDYFFEVDGPGLPSTLAAFHNSASLDAVGAELRKHTRVDRTDFLWSYFAANDLGWVTEKP